MTPSVTLPIVRGFEVACITVMVTANIFIQSPCITLALCSRALV